LRLKVGKWVKNNLLEEVIFEIEIKLKLRREFGNTL
jgi:hypothetical protein